MPIAEHDDEVHGRRPAEAEGRKVIHVDMDAFYASVEQRDDPALRGRPVAVGGSSARGVVAAASYEARVFGVRSAMPSVTARRRCPGLVFVKPRFEVYKAISQEVRAIFAEYTELIEPLSLDEAYLDVTVNRAGLPSATRIAEEIRRKIRERLNLTASAGVSYNKFLAKLASDHRKPDGLFVITPGMGEAFVQDLPVGRFHGVGPATTRKMNRLGIFTGRDLRDRPLAALQEAFGKVGPFYHAIARGIDHRPVRPDRIRKSVGAENTFSEDLREFADMKAALEPLIDKVWSYCERSGIAGRTIVLKMKYSDFRQITRSRSDAAPVPDRAALARVAFDLLGPLCPVPEGVRLLGVTLSGLEARDAAEPPPAQMRLSF